MKYCPFCKTDTWHSVSSTNGPTCTRCKTNMFTRMNLEERMTTGECEKSEVTFGIVLCFATIIGLMILGFAYLIKLLA